jgi:2-oxoisovalerate dehydrogenase E1 component
METVRLTKPLDSGKITFETFRQEVLNDYRIAVESRETSLLGRKEVLTGKAKFGIFGDGKELPQIAMAKVFKEGDFRSGYYRDQTFMMASGLLTVRQFFAQLYAHTCLVNEPMTAGRQMNGHYASRWLDEEGHWLSQTKLKNISADISPTAGQMPRLLGLAYASKAYRNIKELKEADSFSKNGNEVAFGTIGDASTSEGLFWETLNAASVLQVPMAVSVWDDGYGISVPKSQQTVKGSISEALSGFSKNEDGPGIIIYKVKAWDYPALIETYQKGIAICRQDHIPVLFHVEECTQPQGHSTSGSHERYKSKKRLQWEEKFDGIAQFKEWILKKNLATEHELEIISNTAREFVKQEKNLAWDAFLNDLKTLQNNALERLNSVANAYPDSKIQDIIRSLQAEKTPQKRDILSAARMALLQLRNAPEETKSDLAQWLKTVTEIETNNYSSHLYSQSTLSATRIEPIDPEFSEEEEMVDGRIILRENFDHILANHPEFIAFGEDVGGIGGVNQTFEGLQKKYGEERIFDTGIREATIAGQGIGMAMRGLRPYAEIQYLDYLLYCVQILSDDLSTLQYRTRGGQKAPLIIATRGHRLEGIWHSGSPLGMIINSLRGMIVCVPRDMTRAAGMYNTLLASDDPALVIEPLNGYRLKEKNPTNIGKYKTPIGKVEVIREGNDVTVLSYGSTLRIIEEAANRVENLGISVQIIDAQTLLPFDIHHETVQHLQKTNRLLIVDEDVSGGASAFLLQQILEKQNGYLYLDAPPRTLTGKDHRPAYGSDGDYFSKPSAEDITEAIYNLMRESFPARFPELYLS